MENVKEVTPKNGPSNEQLEAIRGVVIGELAGILTRVKEEQLTLFSFGIGLSNGCCDRSAIGEWRYHCTLGISPSYTDPHEYGSGTTAGEAFDNAVAALRTKGVRKAIAAKLPRHLRPDKLEVTLFLEAQAAKRRQAVAHV